MPAARVLSLDRVVGNGAALFKAARQIGAECIVSKRAGSPYGGGPNRDWLRAKVNEEGAFVITGFVEREAVAVAELKDGALVPAGLVKFGFAGKEPWQRLDSRRAGLTPRSGVVPVRSELECGISGATAAARSATACCCRSADVRTAQKAC